jgi:hypothetical protein
MAYRYRTADQVGVADERTTLEAFPHHHRAAVCNKVRGVSNEVAVRRLPVDELPALRWTADDPTGDFRLQPGETVQTLLTDYEAQCGVSRTTAARYELSDAVGHPRLDQVSLRWIYVHMIEETARHLGHADILREQLDGTTGD